jgi:hypothetical protein
MNPQTPLQTTPPQTSAGDQPTEIIGFYLTLPHPAAEYETFNAAFLLEFIIRESFRAKAVEFHTQDKERLFICNIRHEVLGWAWVKERGRALDTLADTFAAAGLLGQAQLAWRCFDKQAWQDYHPDPTPVSFALRLKAAKEWAGQRADFLAILKRMSEILAGYPQVVAQRDDLLAISKDLLKSLEQLSSGRPPALPPANPSDLPPDAPQP